MTMLIYNTFIWHRYKKIFNIEYTNCLTLRKLIQYTFIRSSIRSINILSFLPTLDSLLITMQWKAKENIQKMHSIIATSGILITLPSFQDQ